MATVVMSQMIASGGERIECSAQWHFVGFFSINDITKNLKQDARNQE